MKLLRVVTENVRNLPDGEYPFADRTSGEPLPVVIVSGPMASGKTSLLEAIAMAKERAAAYGAPPDVRRFLRRGAAEGRVVLTLRLDESERRASDGDPIAEIDVCLAGPRPALAPKLAKLLSSYSHAPSGKMEYFPAQRRLDAVRSNDAEPDELEEAHLRLRSDASKYRGVVPWLRARLRDDARELGARLSSGGFVTASDAPDSLTPLRRALEAMCPRLRLAGLGADGEPGFVRDDGSQASLAELSDAEKDALLLATTFQRIGLDHSIVLLDRLELHAHPEDQRRWLTALGALGRDNQLVVATSSDVLLSTAGHGIQLAPTPA
jgi:hypothetical protein